MSGVVGMKPILRPICWIIGHRWGDAGDYLVCWRCGHVNRHRATLAEEEGLSRGPEGQGWSKTANVIRKLEEALR